jgi:hypothetical protein
MMMLDDIESWSDDSSDETWTPSIGLEEDSDDDEDVVWRETPFCPGDIRVTFDKTDGDLIENYVEETKQIKKHLVDEL